MDLYQPSHSSVQERITQETDSRLLNISNPSEESLSITTSTLGTTTPLVMSTSQYNTSPFKEFMTLTPVKIPDNYSPSKNALTISNRKNSANEDLTVKLNQLNNYLPTYDTIYQEKFNSISSQLVSLLENLNIIYQKIGHSSSDITTKEKSIFNELSSLLKKFYDEAEIEMKELSSNNERDQDILNRILVILNDPSGVETIPDLYIRNAIIRQSSKKVPQSPKKPLTLLNKKTSLETAQKFTFSMYIPKLIIYSQKCLNLQKLAGVLDDNNIAGINPSDTTRYNLPTLDNLEQILRDLDYNFNYQDDLTLLNRIIRKHEKIILESESYKDLSKEKIKKINTLTGIYEREFDSRIKQNKEMVNEIQSLLIELNINPEDDLSEEQLKGLHNNMQIISLVQNVTIGDNNSVISLPRMKLNVTQLEMLQGILDKYLICRSKRVSERKRLLQDCQKLWTILKISNAYIENFLNENKGLSLKVFDNLRIEHKKLEQEKKKQIKQLVTESLNNINELWDTLHIEDDYRNSFNQTFHSLFDNSMNLQDDENLLKICNLEIEQLNEKMKIYEPVLKLIKEFELLQEDELFLDNSSKDSSRLLSRNSHKILLKEENTRKRLTRHFPKVLSDLSRKLVEAEEIFQKPFLYKNQRLLDVVENEEEEFLRKYPRSRLNMGDRRSRTHKERIVSNSSSDSNGSNFSNLTTSSSHRNKVSKRHIPESARKLANRSNIQAKKSPIKYQSGLTEADLMKNARILSNESKLPRFNENIITNTQDTKLLPPTRIARKILSTPIIRRPNLRKESSSNLSSRMFSTPILRTESQELGSHGIKPTQLFPLSVSKLNTMKSVSESRIPSLIKTKSISNSITKSVGKENLQVSMPLESPRINNNIAQPIRKLSSPYHEPDHSVYQLSRSPDGKFKLSIQERELGNPFDDTSLLED